MKRLVRCGCRVGGFLGTCLRAGLERPATDARSRAEWNCRTGTRIARALGLEVVVEGDPGEGAVWIGNHLGYLDVVGLSTVRPVAFVSKAEVARWPLVGGLARRGGSLFLERDRRMAVGVVVAAMRSRVESGVPVVFFPEGTSSDGTTVLPFHASLFAPVVEGGWLATPFAIGFEQSGPDPVEVAYWGDMSFGPHFLRFAGHGGVRMRILFGEPARLSGDRKAQAREWRERVVALHGRLATRMGRVPAVGEGRENGLRPRGTGT